MAGVMSMRRLFGCHGSGRASGGSDIHVNVSKELTGYVTGGGDVYYSGNPEMVSLMQKGIEIHMSNPPCNSHSLL
jgi:hypothetical protein